MEEGQFCLLFVIYRVQFRLEAIFKSLILKELEDCPIARLLGRRKEILYWELLNQVAERQVLAGELLKNRFYPDLFCQL